MSDISQAIARFKAASGAARVEVTARTWDAEQDSSHVILASVRGWDSRGKPVRHMGSGTGAEMQQAVDNAVDNALRVIRPIPIKKAGPRHNRKASGGDR